MMMPILDILVWVSRSVGWRRMEVNICIESGPFFMVVSVGEFLSGCLVVNLVRAF